jgi:hypothetical protein
MQSVAVTAAQSGLTGHAGYMRDEPRPPCPVLMLLPGQRRHEAHDRSGLENTSEHLMGAAGSHAGSHADEQPSHDPDPAGQQGETRPRSRTVLNASGRPYRNLRIKRLGLSPCVRASGGGTGIGCLDASRSVVCAHAPGS